MGWILMSERELNRIEVLSQVTQGRMTAVTAAHVLGLSRRQVHRLLKRFQAYGPAAIRHKARGRVSNNRTDPAVRAFAVTLVKESYADFGPTFAAEKLAEDHGLKVSRETLRKWMQDAGFWLSRKQRLPSAPPAPGMPRRARPDRRLRSSLVRGSRAGLHPSGLHRTARSCIWSS